MAAQLPRRRVLTGAAGFLAGIVAGLDVPIPRGAPNAPSPFEIVGNEIRLIGRIVIRPDKP